MHTCTCHALMREPFSMILFENKHNTWLIPVILLNINVNLHSYKITPKLKYAFLLLSSIRHTQKWSKDLPGYRIGITIGIVGHLMIKFVI